MTFVAAPVPSRRDKRKPSPVFVAIAATACIAAGAGGYLLLSGFAGNSTGTTTASPVVHHATHAAHAAHAARPAAAATAAQRTAAAQVLLSRSFAAVLAKGSMETTATYVHGGLTGHATAWMGTTTASATIDLVGKGQLTMRIVGPAAYFVGDTGALESMGGVDAEAAQLLGGKWLEIAKGDEGYDEIMAGSTLADEATQDWFRGTVTELPAIMMDGRRVLPLRGAPSKDEDAGPGSTATLYVAADGDPLPLKYEVSSPTDSELDVYGGWGSEQTVLAPPVAIDKAWLVNAAAAASASGQVAPAAGVA